MFSIAKGKRINATQEMLALGFCNIAGSFVQAFPATGSFSRTAINNTSGVRTPLGGLFTGGIVLAALAFLSPYFYFIPKVRHHVFYASHLYMHIATSYISVGCCGYLILWRVCILVYWSFRRSRRKLVWYFLAFLFHRHYYNNNTSICFRRHSLQSSSRLWFSWCTLRMCESCGEQAVCDEITIMITLHWTIEFNPSSAFPIH